MKPQLALHYRLEAAKKKPKFEGRTYVAHEKIDGIYGYIDIGTPDAAIRSRAGRVIPALADASRHLVIALACEAAENGVFRLIFEVTVSDVYDFHTANGILNRKEICPNPQLWIHDAIYEKEADAGYGHRQSKVWGIKTLIDNHRAPRVFLAPCLGESKHPEDWMRWAQRIWKNGGEGIILRDLYGPYEPGKRNASLMKIKKEETLDLYVIGTVAGEGKYAGTLGALTCRDSKGNIHQISGMTDQERHLWWSTPGAPGIVGKVIEVQCMEILPNGSLREPRFKAVRHDKGMGDID